MDSGIGVRVGNRSGVGRTDVSVALVMFQYKVAASDMRGPRERAFNCTVPYLFITALQ